MSSKPRKPFLGIARPAGKGDDLAKLLTSVVNRAIKSGSPVLVNKPAKKVMSPKVQQQVARSKTKRRAMAKTEQMAKKYYGKK
jgi:hypothetical protein